MFKKKSSVNVNVRFSVKLRPSSQVSKVRDESDTETQNKKLKVPLKVKVKFRACTGHGMVRSNSNFNSKVGSELYTKIGLKLIELDSKVNSTCHFF